MSQRYVLSLAVFFVCTIVTAQNRSSYDQNRPIGWGNVGATITGSNDENPVTVTSQEELLAAFDKKGRTAKKTIYLKGVIKVSGLLVIKDQENKAIYGLPGSALENTTHSSIRDKSGILELSRCKNIIIRNVTFKGAGAYDMDGKDNLVFHESQHIWLDHCDFQDGVDGNFDINSGSDFISVTWCRFRYLLPPWPGGSGGSDDHRYSNLIGSSDNQGLKDEGHLRITFANCWWDEGCKERMPRIRFGQVHILNCLYSSSNTHYCVGAGYRSNTFIEKCAFTSKGARKSPWSCYATSQGKTDYNITVKDCYGAHDEQQHSGNTPYFIPSDAYTYPAYDSCLVEQVVSDPKHGAGATLSNPQTFTWN